MLIPVLVVGFLLDYFGSNVLFPTSPFYDGTSKAIYWNVNERLGLTNFLASLFFLQTIACEALGSNGPLWSLANEFWYYTLFPLAVVAGFSSRPTTERLVSAALFVVICAFVGWPILSLFPVWLMGVVIALLPRPDIPSIGVTVLIACVGLGNIGLATWARLHPSLTSDVVLGVSFSALVWCVLMARGEPNRLYKWISHMVANMSYTLYLMHLPTLTFLAAALSANQVDTAVAAALSLVATFVGALAMYLMFERKTPKIRAYVMKRISPRTAGRASAA